MADELDRAMNRAVMRAAQKARDIVVKAISEWDVELDYEVRVIVRSPIRAWGHMIVSRLGEEESEIDGCV